MKLHIYQDKTAVEVFLQDGEEAASFFVFPTKAEKPKLVISADRKLERMEGSLWELGGFIWNAR